MPNPMRIDPATLARFRDALVAAEGAPGARRPTLASRRWAGPVSLPLALGVIAGYRSMAPLALLAAAARRPEGEVARALAGLGPLGALRSRPALIVTGAAALGEMIADKLPFVPSRVRPGPLGARVIIGATTGAVAARARGGPAPLGAALGGLTAAGSAAIAYSTRRAITRRTRIPDFAVGLLEDALVLGLGALALRRSLFAPSSE